MKNYLTSIPPLDNIEYEGGTFTYNNLEPENAFVYAKNSDGSIDYTTLNSYAARTYVEKINVPSGIKTLLKQSMQFANTSTINLPDGIETITDRAFHQSNAKVYNIPSSITTITSLSFKEDSNITINIDRKENAISGSPCGATNATINWTGTN